ncbi:MAG: carboxymuconolactone decarboxylase family protein [Rhodoferax sp.]|nr:carboxymuconolactone decarboxylase family protein [Rhodoferax sp.]MDP3653734.1 carboxymuconolactone decarboxylase family protein [Rhodoferax sp.]
MYPLIDPQTATGITKALLDSTQKQLSRVPNLYRAMANSPKTLGAYLEFRAALQGGLLDKAMCERIALLTAQLNDCDYCVAAHHFRGGKLGLSAEDLAHTRMGQSDSPKIHAALVFVEALVKGQGAVAASTLNTVAQAGWSADELGEMVGHVALNVFSNYFKQVAKPELDFPAAPALGLAASPALHA